MLCWRCLEDLKGAGIRFERLNGSTGRMDKCQGCGKRRLIEEYVILGSGPSRAQAQAGRRTD